MQGSEVQGQAGLQSESGSLRTKTTKDREERKVSRNTGEGEKGEGKEKLAELSDTLYGCCGPSGHISTFAPSSPNQLLICCGRG